MRFFESPTWYRNLAVIIVVAAAACFGIYNLLRKKHLQRSSKKKLVDLCRRYRAGEGAWVSHVAGLPARAGVRCALLRCEDAYIIYCQGAIFERPYEMVQDAQARALRLDGYGMRGKKKNRDKACVLVIRYADERGMREILTFLFDGEEEAQRFAGAASGTPIYLEDGGV